MKVKRNTQRKFQRYWKRIKVIILTIVKNILQNQLTSLVLEICHLYLNLVTQIVPIKFQKVLVVLIKYVLLKEKKNDGKAFEDELLKIETEKLNALLKSNTTAHIDDDDMFFLKSLHPYFKTIHPIQKLSLRNQIQSVIIN